MKPAQEGYRVAVVGASSLLGKELLSVLEEQAFPVSRLVTFEADEEEPDLPIVDLRGESQAAVEDREVSEAELDFAFLAVRPRSLPAFLSAALQRTVQGSVQDLRPSEPSTEARHCVVIDLAGAGLDGGLAAGLPDGASSGQDIARTFVSRRVSIPFLDRRYSPPPESASEAAASGFLVSPHPVVIVISGLLLRLASRFPLQRAVAQVFVSASEIGPRAIDELQKQTVSLLSFQKIPSKVFGTQLAFNLLRRPGKSGESHLPDLESRSRMELQHYLRGRVPLPALHLVQAPVFYSLAISLYVETARAVTAEEATAALAGERVRVRRLSQDSPTHVEVVGSSDILVDAVAIDATHPNGIWLWAVADNLRLAALNAVEIAESLRLRVRA